MSTPVSSVRGVRRTSGGYRAGTITETARS